MLDFWFGDLEGQYDYPVEKAGRWFNGGSDFNTQIRRRFEANVQAAKAGELSSWETTPHGMLALILLLDQFTRNIYAGARAFEADAQALALAKKAVENSFDLKLKHVQRVFIYLPFEHSEKLAMQELSVSLFEKLCSDVPPAAELPFLNMLDYAKRHYEIINRFNRFPHRNAALGRASSAEETEFLKTPDSSF